MMELPETFLKLIQLALIAIGVLSIFFLFITYNVDVISNQGQREINLLGNTLLSNSCLTDIGDGKPIKGLFLQSKLQACSATPCINYPEGKITVTLLDGSGQSWSCQLGTKPLAGLNAGFSVAVKKYIVFRSAQ